MKSIEALVRIPCKRCAIVLTTICATQWSRLRAWTPGWLSGIIAPASKRPFPRILTWVQGIQANDMWLRTKGEALKRLGHHRDADREGKREFALCVGTSCNRKHAAPTRPFSCERRQCGNSRPPIPTIAVVKRRNTDTAAIMCPCLNSSPVPCGSRWAARR